MVTITIALRGVKILILMFLLINVRGRIISTNYE